MKALDAKPLISFNNILYRYTPFPANSSSSSFKSPLSGPDNLRLKLTWITSKGIICVR